MDHILISRWGDVLTAHTPHQTGHLRLRNDMSCYRWAVLSR
jgi:hypothetical protein